MIKLLPKQHLILTRIPTTLQIILQPILHLIPPHSILPRSNHILHNTHRLLPFRNVHFLPNGLFPCTLHRSPLHRTFYWLSRFPSIGYEAVD